MFSSAQTVHSKSKARSTPSPSVSGESPESCSCLLVCVQELEPPKPLCPDLLFFADNCKKLGLVFDDVVGIVEIINSRDVKVQVSALFSLLALEQLYFQTRSVQLWRIPMKHHLSLGKGLKFVSLSCFRVWVRAEAL